MDSGNVTISGNRVRRDIFSTQSSNNIVGLPDYSSKSASPHTAPSVNNQHNHKMKDQIPRTPNNPQQTPGAIRIIDRRNRFNQMKREPRSSSVPVCKVRAPADSRNRSNRTDLASWNVVEEDSVSSGKNPFLHVKRNVHTLRDRFFPPSSQNALNGKPPPYFSTNHLDFSQDGWSPPKHHPRRRLSNAVDSSRSQSAQPMDTSNLRPLNGRHKKNLSLSGIGNDPSIMRSGITLTDVDKRQTPVVETNPFDEKTRTPFEIASTSLDSSLVSDAVRTTERIRLAGKTLFNKDPNLGIEYLIHQRILNRDPNEIAEFLAEKGLSRQAIGEYFGRLSDPLANLVTEAFIRRLNLRKVELDVALRRLLQQLHPDGESQKIEFLLTVLKNCYIEQNVEDVAKEFNDSETIGVLAYSIMLLHTTFYNQNARKHGKPMTKIEFINNNKGIDGGKDISTSLLEGIYDRVAEREFKTLPDPTYRLRKVDDLFSGSVKPENFVQRHRRFVAWFSGLEVFDFTARKPIIQRPSSQIRCLFIFNDLLVITKPVGSYRNNAVDEMLNGGTHRIRSFDRLAIRVGSPTLTSAEIIAEHPVVQTVHARSQDYRNYQHYSTDIPLNGPFLVRQIISLENIKILLFECESYRFGVQLCDEESVLTSISLPTAHARKKFIELLNESIWETGEVKRFSNSAPITPM